MLINESTNVNASLTVQVDNLDKPVVLAGCNLSNANKSINVSFTVVEPDLLAANQAAIQTQMDEFLTLVRTKMTELGYSITV